jgi:hypothetical protein
MFLCASNFGWTPEQVKELSTEELRLLFKAGNKLSPKIDLGDKTGKGLGAGSSQPSSEGDVKRFLQKIGQKG